MATIPEGTSTATAQAHNDSNTGNGSSSIKDKLHHIGEKLALVPPRQEELTNRLEEAEAKGDKDEIAKVKRRISASNQDASTAVE